MNATGTDIATDKIFPNLALNNYLGIFAGLSFILGLTAATFSSADSVLTTLTTSAYIDLLEIDKNENMNDKTKTRVRTFIHILFAFALLICILLFKAWNSQAIIDTILLVAGYTYGPLLGLFTFGLFTRKKVKDHLVPVVCFIAPVITYLITWLLKDSAFKIGYELILYNGLISFMLLFIILQREKVDAVSPGA